MKPQKKGIRHLGTGDGVLTVGSQPLGVVEARGQGCEAGHVCVCDALTHILRLKIWTLFQVVIVYAPENTNHTSTVGKGRVFRESVRKRERENENVRNSTVLLLLINALLHIGNRVRESIEAVSTSDWVAGRIL